MTNYPDISKYPYICVDVETTGLNWWEHDIFGVAMSMPDGKSYYWDIRKDPTAINYLQAALPTAKMIVNHNIKFDHHFLNKLGVKLPDNLWCTQIAACLINEHEPFFSLEILAKKYTDVRKDTDFYHKMKDIFGGLPTKNVQMKNISNAPTELVGEYAKADTIAALKIYEWQVKEIEKQALGQVMDLESKLYWAVIDMESRGIRIDVERAHNVRDILNKKIQELQPLLDTLVGFKCNPNSSNDMQKVFSPTFDIDKQVWIAKDGTHLPQTPTGNPSFGKEALEKSDMKEAFLVCRIKTLFNASNTFITGQILSKERRGYLYPNINQTKGESMTKKGNEGTSTGRLSYTSPNLQNQPARDADMAAYIRTLFLPDPGYTWGCWDYAQFEFRMFAHYIGDPKINKMYADDPLTDFHQIVADMTGLPRSASKAGGANAKQVNLGLVFGMGMGRLAEQMGLPYTIEKVKFKDGPPRLVYIAGPEAEEIMAKYHAAMPSVKVLLKKIPSVAASRGYTKSIIGRRHRYPGGKFTYKAPAHLYQGSSADCMKQKLIELHDYFKGTEGRLILSVHDEFNCSLPKGDEKMVRDVTEILERYDGNVTPIKLNVPIRTDFGEGKNWAVASGKGVK